MVKSGDYLYTERQNPDLDLPVSHLTVTRVLSWRWLQLLSRVRGRFVWMTVTKSRVQIKQKLRVVSTNFKLDFCLTNCNWVKDFKDISAALESANADTSQDEISLINL